MDSWNSFWKVCIFLKNNLKKSLTFKTSGEQLYVFILVGKDSLFFFVGFQTKVLGPWVSQNDILMVIYLISNYHKMSDGFYGKDKQT